ncbi:hypothetical protein AB0I51_39065 [Streptomyces sp. NPDC050549]|uniref:hypothetical protein n=1 Tax=Streptomyces sp. NPDC050549 TaxID=3155406 RepID=UPI00342FADA4
MTVRAALDRRPGERLPPASLDADGGRGLHLVQAYATSRGGRPIGDGGLLDRGAGKLLWFEAAHTHPAEL